MKLKFYRCPRNGSEKYLHWCPGCNQLHVIQTKPADGIPGPVWTFDGNMSRPTFSPSINIVGQCHYFIVTGLIKFQPDCKHPLAGNSMLLPDIPDGELDC